MWRQGIRESNDAWEPWMGERLSADASAFPASSLRAQGCQRQQAATTPTSAARSAAPARSSTRRRLTDAEAHAFLAREKGLSPDDVRARAR